MNLIDERLVVKDVAAALGVSRKSVSAWNKAAEGARRAHRARPQHVSECRLSNLQQAQLKCLLRAGPRKAGFPTDLWTLPSVAKLVEREFVGSYPPSHLGRLLQLLGFFCQKPRGGARIKIPKW